MVEASIRSFAQALSLLFSPSLPLRAAIVAGVGLGGCFGTTTGSGHYGGDPAAPDLAMSDAGDLAMPPAEPDLAMVAPVCTSGMNGGAVARPSQSHAPGLACIACHKDQGGPTYTISGTVYPTLHEPDLCADASGGSQLQVVVTGADGKVLTLSVNTVGNFFGNAVVALPYRVKVVRGTQEVAAMAPQTSGDCNGCHTQDGAQGAPGRIVAP